MFKITLNPISVQEFPKSKGEVLGKAGGKVVFEGKVRIENNGQKVKFLEYETNLTLAESIGQRIIEEAIKRFHLDSAACIHRVGKLQLGESAIWVEVESGHRREGFEACEWIVDEVKRTVPIWKKEHFEDGDSEWLGGAVCDESEIYSRQLALPEIGACGQQKLKDSKALVVGLGGLGCSAAAYLASAGVGKIILIDPGLVEASNIHRQILYGVHDIGKVKVDVARNRLQVQNPFIEIEAVQTDITSRNAGEFIAGRDIVLDCTDTFASKFAINDACMEADVLLIHAAIYQFEGQMMSIRKGWPCLRCLWPNEPLDGLVPTCEDAGVLGPIVGMIGAAQALEAIKSLCGIDKSPEVGKLITFDLRSYQLQTYGVPCSVSCSQCNSACQSCNSKAAPTVAEDISEINLQFNHWDEMKSYYIVDIREPIEIKQQPLPVEAQMNMPVSSFKVEMLPKNESILFICAHGIRSKKVASAVRHAGFKQAFSLENGVCGMDTKPF